MSSTWRLRRSLVSLAFGALLLGASAPLVVDASASAPSLRGTSVSHLASAAPAKYLLALGDSLAAGYQPTDGLVPPPKDPATGYSDTGYPGSYPADIAAARHLRLADLACPGETTRSMTGSPAIGACTTVYRGEFHASSQLAAATTFLSDHRGEVALVTLDIGANDIDGCVSSHGVSLACLSAAQATIGSQLPPIVAGIEKALRVDDPATPLIAMNYYDPFLSLAYAPGGLTGSTFAALSVGATDAFNRRLADVYKRASVPVANVAGAFRTGSVLPTTRYAGHLLPIDVADVCRWTFMCPLPHSTSRPDIHADTVGYRVIARAFEQALTTR